MKNGAQCVELEGVQCAKLNGVRRVGLDGARYVGRHLWCPSGHCLASYGAVSIGSECHIFSHSLPKEVSALGRRAQCAHLRA